jgi:hypothetical protein
MRTLMPASPKMIELRKVLAERFPHEPALPSLCLPTGWSPLDSILGGGLPRGGITQLVVPNLSSGGMLVLHEIILSLHQTSRPVVLVDGKDCFDPSLHQPLLLWIRCLNAFQALKATDLILRDGNLPLAILDLKQNPELELRKIPGTTWYRFQRILEESKNSLFVMTRHPIVTSSIYDITMTNHININDMSSSSIDLIRLVDLKISRHGIQQEYRYA